MYKNKEKQKQYMKEKMQARRKGITKGITEQGITPGYNKEVISLQEHLARTVTGSKRKKIQLIVNAFAESHHPEYAQEVRYGINGPTLDVMSQLLDITG